MTPYEYLSNKRETMPSWLRAFQPGDAFDCQQFFSHRVVYYPGSGFDGHPVKLFGSTHSAHSFIYVDYGQTQLELEEQLGHRLNGFRGYHTLARINLTEADLVPNGWDSSVDRSALPPDLYYDYTNFANKNFSSPFGFLEILEREMGRTGQYGPARLAILFLGADGYAAYEALFCNRRFRQVTHDPFAIILQDHGFGGNYALFGGAGGRGDRNLLEQIARRGNVLPQFLLVADNTAPWQDFERVFDVAGDSFMRNAENGPLRFLYEHVDKSQETSGL